MKVLFSILIAAFIWLSYIYFQETTAEYERRERHAREYQEILGKIHEEVCIISPPARYDFISCENSIRRLTVHYDIVGQLPATRDIRLDDARLVNVPGIRLMYKIRPVVVTY